MSSQRQFNFRAVPASTTSSEPKSSEGKRNVSSQAETSENKRTKAATSFAPQQTTLNNSGKEVTSKYFSQKPTSSAVNQQPPKTPTPVLNLSNLLPLTRVVKMQRKNGAIVQDCDVYIGRGVYKGGWNLPKSKWHNPYPVSSCGGSAAVACQKYRDYVLREPELLASLEELDGKVLGCWCKSEPSNACHGDTLLELLSMKKRGELDAYVKEYLKSNPTPLYPISNKK